VVEAVLGTHPHERLCDPRRTSGLQKEEKRGKMGEDGGRRRKKEEMRGKKEEGRRAPCM
jgi:hypothetical protein